MVLTDSLQEPLGEIYKLPQTPFTAGRIDSVCEIMFLISTEDELLQDHLLLPHT